jgi:hypothetical protein
MRILPLSSTETPSYYPQMKNIAGDINSAYEEGVWIKTHPSLSSKSSEKKKKKKEYFV